MTASLKAWLLLAGIFVVGVVTGSALTFGLGSHFIHSHGESEMREHWLPYLVQQLNLTPDQRAKIKPIVQDAISRIQALHHEEVGRGSEIFKQANEQITAVLTPEQKVALHKLELEREVMFNGHLRPRMPQHDGMNGSNPGGPGGFQHSGMNERMTPPSFMERPTHVPPPDTQTNAPPQSQ